MLAMLDNLPIWKQVTSLPQKIESIEERINLIEKTIWEAYQCPNCKEKLHIKNEIIYSDERAAGKDGGQIPCQKKRTLRCEQCAYEDYEITMIK